MKIVNEGDKCRVFLSGEVDHHAAALLRPEIDRELQATRPEVTVLDFSGVSFMDSSAVGLIMGRFRLAGEWGGKIELTGLSALHKRVMLLAGVDKIAKITEKSKGDFVNDYRK